MSKKIDFFIVGFQKSGTSSLSNYLNNCKNIKVLKEPNYFCKDFHLESSKFHKHNHFYLIRDFESYKKLFEKSSKKIIGDKSPNYLYSKTAAKNIYNYNPNAKIIIILRDPANFLSSWHNHALTMGHENYKSIAKAINQEKNRKKFKKIPKSCKQPSYLFYSEMIKFEKQIKRYTELFPKKNIKVIIFEDFIKNPQTYVEETISFLGIKNLENYNQNSFSNKNPGRMPRSLYLQQIIRNPNLKIKKFLRKLLPISIQKKIYRSFFDINRGKKKSKLNQKDKLQLKKLGENEAKNVAKFLQKESLTSFDLLKLWEYK